MTKKTERVEAQTKARLDRLRANYSAAENQEIAGYITRISEHSRLGNMVSVNTLWTEFESKYPEYCKIMMDGWNIITAPKKPRKRGSRFYP